MSRQKYPNIYAIDTNKYGLLDPSNTLGDVQFVVPEGNGIALKNKAEYLLSKVKTITSAQVLALFTTPIEIIAAPAAGYAVLVNKVTIRHGAGTAYADIAAGEDLVLKYTNAAGAEISNQIETTGFLDQATAQIRSAIGSTLVTPVATAPVVLHLLVGNITTGDFDLEVLVDYNIIPTDFIG